jgi:hypothetical protein
VEVDEPDGEAIYHVEAGAVTLHFFTEEWRSSWSWCAAGPD